MESIDSEEQLKAKPFSHRSLVFENSPVKPGIDGDKIKTFEEFLDMSLKNIEQEDSIIVDETTIPKRPFLRKGTGLSRFNPPVKQQRTCSAQDQNNNPSRSKVQRSLFHHKRDGIEVLPRTCTRITAQIKDIAVTDHMKSHTNRKGVKFANKKITASTVDRADSLENLERLLHSVRDRKKQVIQHLQDEVNQEDFVESSSSWESEDDDSEEERYHHRYARRDKKGLRWTKKAKHSSNPSKCQRSLAEATAGPYSQQLVKCINRLEDRLDSLRSRCHTHEEVNGNRVSPSKVSERDETSMLKREITDLNEKIVGLTEGLKTLQVLTGKVASAAHGEAKRTKVTVHRNSGLSKRESIISTEIAIPEKRSESVVHFENGCRMHVLPDKTVVHIFSNGTKQSSFADGSKLIEFPNGQTERTLVNGVKYISYPNQSHRIIHPNGSEELTMSDGTIIRLTPDGTEVVIMPNGEREIRSKEFTRREYRSGIVKTIYLDGTQETRYPNGRLRIKDRFSNVIVDSMARPLDQL